MTGRPGYPEKLKQAAMQMLLDGHWANNVAERLGVTSPNVLYRWTKLRIGRGGPATRTSPI